MVEVPEIVSEKCCMSGLCRLQLNVIVLWLMEYNIAAELQVCQILAIHHKILYNEVNILK